MAGILFNNPIISLCFVLLVASFWIMITPNKKCIALEASILCFFITLDIFEKFNPFCAKFQFFEEYYWFYNKAFFKINLTFGIDGISIYFLILTTYIMPIVFLLIHQYSHHSFLNGFLLCLLSIELFLILAFCSLDLLIFFLAFEGILIPMVFIIGVFGTNRRRIKAAYFFFMYSFISALASLIAILYIYAITGSLNFLILQDYTFNTNQQIFCWFLLFITFASKVPMFPFHIWLPEAHVEAPTTGSMILASLLLKLGGYGFLRFSLPLFPEGTFYFLPLVKTLALLGIIYSSFAALYQLDLKKIVAYSSVAHMNLALLGIFALHPISLQGSIFTMLSHGVISAALFLIIGSIYDRFHTRSIAYLGGLYVLVPRLSAFFFFFMVCNISFPGTSSFIGEFLTLIGIFADNLFVYLCTCIGSLLCGIYSLRTFSFVCFGTLPANNYLFENIVDLSRNEDNCLKSFLFVACLMGLKPNLFLFLTYLPIKIILTPYKSI